MYYKGFGGSIYTNFRRFSVFSVFNEKFMAPSKLVDFSLKFGSIGISMKFDCFSLSLRALFSGK